MAFCMDTHNELCAKLFSVVEASHDSGDSGSSLGVHGMVQSLGPLVHGCSGDTKTAVSGLVRAVAKPPHGTSGLHIAIAVLTSGEKLKYKHHPKYILTSNATDPVQATTYINNHAARLTAGTIRHLVSPENFINKLCIVSSTQFNGRWDDNFEPTEDQDFHMSKSKVVKVPTICSKIYGMWKSTILSLVGVDIFQLKLRNGGWLRIILPNGVATKDNMLSIIDIIDWKMLGGSFKCTSNVTLYLPKFCHTTNHKKLAKIFSDAGQDATMGVSSLFDENRELDDMWEGKNFSSTFIEMQSWSEVKIDERGVSSKSKTEIMCTDSIGPKSYWVNRPFIYVTVTESGMIVDMGLYLGPKV